MEKNFIIGFILGTLFDLLNSLMVEPIRIRYRRNCNYDCSRCKVWDCDVHVCNRQKIKDIKKGKINNE